MKTALAVVLLVLIAGCSAAHSAPAVSMGAACTRFRVLGDQADAPATTGQAMRRDLAAMAAIPAPPHLAALFREFAADDLAVIGGTKGTIPGLRDVIRELNAACGTTWETKAS